MPPSGYMSVTISDDLAEKLVGIMDRHDANSYAEAVEYAVDVALAQEDELSASDLVDLLAQRVN